MNLAENHLLVVWLSHFEWKISFVKEALKIIAQNKPCRPLLCRLSYGLRWTNSSMVSCRISTKKTNDLPILVSHIGELNDAPKIWEIFIDFLHSPVGQFPKEIRLHRWWKISIFWTSWSSCYSAGCSIKQPPRLRIIQIATGWWFQTFFLVHDIWDVILHIDFHIFQDGLATTNQTTSDNIVLVCCGSWLKPVVRFLWRSIESIVEIHRIHRIFKALVDVSQFLRAPFQGKRDEMKVGVAPSEGA